MKKSIEDVIQNYKNLAIAHGKATLAGDYKAANKNHDKLISLVPMIRDYGKEGVAALARLAEDADDAVVCWSATHLLKSNEAKAIAALNRLTAKSGPMAFNAEMVLKQWKKGELVLP